jgi:hypothetical protein
VYSVIHSGCQNGNPGSSNCQFLADCCSLQRGDVITGGLRVNVLLRMNVLLRVDVLEGLRYYFDPVSWTIFLLCLAAVIAGVLWLINKTTGRPWRDMIALVGAIIIMIACVFVVVSMAPADAAEQHSFPFARTIFVGIGGCVAWFFNRFVSTPRRK